MSTNDTMGGFTDWRWLDSPTDEERREQALVDGLFDAMCSATLARIGGAP